MCRLLVVSTHVGEDYSLLPQTGLPVTILSILIYFSLPGLFFFSHFLYTKNISPARGSLRHVVNVFPPSVAGACPKPGPVSLHRRSFKGCCSKNLLCTSLKPPQLLTPIVSCGRELHHLTKCCVINYLLLLCCLWEVQGRVVDF